MRPYCRHPTGDSRLHGIEIVHIATKAGNALVTQILNRGKPIRLIETSRTIRRESAVGLLTSTNCTSADLATSPRYSAGLPIRRSQHWRKLSTVCPDLLGQDVGVPGMSGHFGDHAEIDDAHADRTNNVMFGRVVELVAGGHFVRTSACGTVFSDHLDKPLRGIDPEAAICTLRGSVALFNTQATQGALEPDPFGDRTVLDQSDGRGERRNPPFVCLDISQVLDRAHQLHTVQVQRVFQKLPFAADERSSRVEYGRSLGLFGLAWALGSERTSAHEVMRDRRATGRQRPDDLRGRSANLAGILAG